MSPRSLPACRLKKSVWEIQRKIYVSVHINACVHICNGAGTDRPRMANQTVWKPLGLLLEISHAMKNYVSAECKSAHLQRIVTRKYSFAFR